ncbi:MAG: indole-3-glycerol phosphate synthase TrpC [Oscillospiraceae bacterium]|jgi:indole-3-glycerol phosphate synthase|nr:indole-3-glycerol phosphate synthase TrpC [Oscillospiraceae bacterium]
MILDALAAAARLRVAAAKAALPLAALRARAEALPVQAGFPFEAALAAPGLSFICEVKKASPSKGVIARDFPYLEIARSYAAAGAAAVSVLTEPEYFLGSDQYLREIAAAVPLPALRKDFTVDAYQIYEAKALGASAVLLICALLDLPALREYHALADSLGLSALVETHSEAEVETALAAGARVVGVNNRDLRSFQVDLATGERLGALLPPGVLFVAESGVATPADAARLRRAGADALLIGEALMRAPDKRAFLEAMRDANED